MEDKIKLPDYKFLPGHEFTASLYTTPRDGSWAGDEFSGINCTCWFQRCYQNDVYNIAVTQMAITSLVVAVWMLDAEADFSSRIGCDFTLVLAACAMKLVIANTLPPVSYITMLEKYNNYTLLFLGFATLCHSAHQHLYHFVDGDGADMYLLRMWSGAWVVFNIIFILYGRWVQAREVSLVKKLGFTRGPGGLASTGAVTDVRALLEQRKARTGPFEKKKKKVQFEKKKQKQKKQKKDKKAKSKPVTDFPNPARESMMAASMKSHEQDCPLEFELEITGGKKETMKPKKRPNKKSDMV
jgi:hypothetical protein